MLSPSGTPISCSALGQHDPDYVDAFYGPAEWKTQAEKEKKSLDAIGAEAAELNAALAKTPANIVWRRAASIAARIFAETNFRAGCAGADVEGQKIKVRRRIARALRRRCSNIPPVRLGPGFAFRPNPSAVGKENSRQNRQSRLWQRYEEWRKPFLIPKEKLDAVFQAAIKECRARTLAHVALPPNESFAVDYVTNKPWGGYNWYKGNFHSVIQVNTDLPIFIDRAVDLAAHEGYPGHHVYNSLLEKNLVRDRGWVEFSVYPLFSPQSLVAEGTANFGRDVAFPTKTERMKFEKEVLFPAAGIDASRADEYYAVQDLMKQLDYAVNEAARRLINGEIDENAAVQWLQKYAVMEPARAQQRMKFIQRYRSYVINYNLGEDMVRRYIEKRSGTDPEKKWSEFAKLLSSPRLPSGLQEN